MTIKLKGVIILVIFFLSIIPLSSADQVEENYVDNLLATKTPMELINTISDMTGNDSLKNIPEDKDKYYEYITDVLGVNLTVAEYAHIIELEANYSCQGEAFDFMMAYINNPDEVYENKYIKDATPKMLIEKIPYYKSFKESWDDIIRTMGPMSYNERLMYLNTESMDIDHVMELYKTSSTDQVLYMLQESLPVLEPLKDLNFHLDGSDYFVVKDGYIKEQLELIQSLFDDFCNRSILAFNQFKYAKEDFNIPNLTDLDDNTSIEYINAKIENFTTLRDSVSDTKDLATMIGGILLATGGLLILLGTLFIIELFVDVGIAILIIGAALILIGGLIMGILPRLDDILHEINMCIDRLEELKRRVNI